METMPPYTYKFVKNQGSSNSAAAAAAASGGLEGAGSGGGSASVASSKHQKKIGYLSKDVKVINDLIDDLSKLKTADNATAVTGTVTAAATEMTNPLEIHDEDKESSQSMCSSSSNRSEKGKPKLKEQVG